MEPTREQALGIYRMMLRIRTFEERVAECFAARSRASSTCRPARRQSRPPSALVEPADLVGATHRGDGQCLAEVKGVYPIGELLAVIDVPGAA